MKTLEDLLVVMTSGKINLSSYDYNFLSSLTRSILSDKNRVTTNQAALVSKLIVKYSRQLFKIGHSVEQCNQLQWKCNVVESKVEFTSAKVELKDNTLYISVPYNKHFISAFREIDHATFEWDKELRMYVSPFSTYALKIAYLILPSFFKIVTYSPELHDLIKDVQDYSATVWSPELVKVGDKYYIGAINESLYTALGDIELNTELATVIKLGHLGVTINKNLISDPDLKIATEPVSRVDIEKLDELGDWIEKAKITTVYAPGRTMPSSILRQFIDEMRFRGIRVEELPNVAHDVNNLVIQSNYPAAVTLSEYRDRGFTKVFVMQNFTKVNMRYNEKSKTYNQR